jgi:hypothetical protein
MAAARGAGANHLLQRQDVRIEPRENGGNPVRTGAAIEAAAAVNVVGRDADGAGSAIGHARVPCYDRAMPKLKSELEVTCPCCKSTLIVDTNLGRVISHREPE